MRDGKMPSVSSKGKGEPDQTPSGSLQGRKILRPQGDEFAGSDKKQELFANSMQSDDNMNLLSPSKAVLTEIDDTARFLLNI
jgi:hypothetical protein